MPENLFSFFLRRPDDEKPVSECLTMTVAEQGSFVCSELSEVFSWGVFISTGRLGTGRGIYVGNYEDAACTALGNFVLVLRMAETSIWGPDRDYYCTVQYIV